MTIPVSTAPAVRQYLYDTITAQLTPDPLSKSASLLVCFDEPGPNQPDDIVCVGKVSRQLARTAMVGGGGAGWLSETYTVEILIEVYRGGDDAQAVFSRAASLADSIISIVRSDISLGGNVLSGHPTATTEDVAWDENHQGRLASYTLEIECFARL